MSTAEAVTWLIDLARSAPQQTASRALLSAALADSVRISSRMFAIGRDRSLPPVNREQGLKWAGRVAAREGNDTVDAGVRSIAADESDDQDVRERAIRILVHPQDDAFLRDLYGRLKASALKERIIRELAESDVPENVAWITQVALDEHEQLEIRDRAIRVLGEQGEMIYLREIYPRLDVVDLKDRVLRSIGEAGGALNLQFLRRVALDQKEPGDLGDRALRAIAEGGERSEGLMSLYDTIGDQELRYRLISLMAERGDAISRGKLADIARADPDPDLRERARRRLAER